MTLNGDCSNKVVQHMEKNQLKTDGRILSHLGMKASVLIEERMSQAPFTPETQTHWCCFTPMTTFMMQKKPIS